MNIARTAAKAASAKLADDIVAIDVSERLAITDVFLIASASNERQVNAIVDGVEEEGRWVRLDYANVVVHVQHEGDRVFYALERLWKDCPEVELQLPEGEAAAGQD